MDGPAEYVPDITEGIARIEDLPAAKIKPRSRVYPKRPCPECGHSSYRDKIFARTLHDLGDVGANRPIDLVVRYSQHRCSSCNRYFNADLTDPGGHDTRRVVHLAVRLVVEDGLPYRTASWHLWRDHRVFVPFATLQNWVEAGGKRAEEYITHDYLDNVLADFSGYIAADGLYDGPHCVLSIVDNHRFQRLIYAVLDHDPTTEDITRFFQRFQEALQVRGLRLQGITTDGSALYPEPIRHVFGSGVKHRVCEFHVLQEITKAVLKAVARTRKQLDAQKTKTGRGRPSSKKARAAMRRNKRLQQKVKDLFDHRHLFVKRTLTDKEKRILPRITRGFPSLRVLRSLMDQVYRLFDRRCRTETALERLGRLRARARRFRSLHEALSKLFSPNVEKALMSLDDSLLPATSNAVERGNRHHRKMQKTVYRVRTGPTICRRTALDMQREEQALGRSRTIATLHNERNETFVSR